MSKKTIGAIIALIVVVSVISVFALTQFQPTSVSPSAEGKQTQTYTGLLVSYNYEISNIDGVESPRD